MKTARASTRVLRVPERTLVANISAGPPTRDFVTLELQTDEGITGIGITFFGGPLIAALRAAVDALAALTIGEDPLCVEAIAEKLRRAAGFAGPGGIFTLALAAIDIALWDIKGKALGQPLCTLVGGFRDCVSTYASGALPRTASVNLLVEAGLRLVELGFGQMKMQLGGDATVLQEIERVCTLRASLGADIDLMADVNQHWRVEQAISIGRQLEAFHLRWLEDPVAHDDEHGLAHVASALTTPITAGEYCYGLAPFRRMLEARSVDIVMIDLLRVGGITPWLKVAALAEAFNVPVVSHLFPEIHVHLVAGVPNGLMVEYMPWTLELFEEVPLIERGTLRVPQRPGLGLAFDAAAMRQWQIG